MDSDSAARESTPFKTPVMQFRDQSRDCPYIPSEQALMPLVYPMSKLDGVEFDAYLAAGRRRSSAFLYHTACPRCSACEPTRIAVQNFRWTSSLLRVRRRAELSLRVTVGPPQVDEQRIQLFNKHRQLRKLGSPDEWDGLEDYEQGFVQSCCDTVELAYWLAKQLVAVSIVDCGLRSLSAVYTYFDPEHQRFSLGTYSILKQVEWALATERTYLYLGMHVASNSHLNYKARFVPQERLIQGVWTGFDEPNDWAKTECSS